MNILIAGGSGLIGQALCRSFCDDGHQVTVLTRDQTPQPSFDNLRYVTSLEHITGSMEVVINLTGAPIADKRWTSARKALLRKSRIDTTQALVKWCAEREVAPRVLISGSAIGYYGASLSGERLTEQSPVIDGFTHQLCADWEAEAMKVQSNDTRLCIIRTGVVLSPDGGALAKMLPAFSLGLGGKIATGRQWFSWVHIDDVVGAIRYLINDEDAKGVFNLTSPAPVTNQIFVRALGQALKKPTVIPTPCLVFKLMLGDGAELLTLGQNVYPERLLKSGYKFLQPDLDGALATVLSAHAATIGSDREA